MIRINLIFAGPAVPDHNDPPRACFMMTCGIINMSSKFYMLIIVMSLITALCFLISNDSIRLPLQPLLSLTQHSHKEHSCTGDDVHITD